VQPMTRVNARRCCVHPTRFGRPPARAIHPSALSTMSTLITFCVQTAWTPTACQRMRRCRRYCPQYTHTTRTQHAHARARALSLPCACARTHAPELLQPTAYLAVKPLGIRQCTPPHGSVHVYCAWWCMPGGPLLQPRALSDDELSRIFTINDPRHHSASDINFFYEVRTLMLRSAQYPGYQKRCHAYSRGTFSIGCASSRQRCSFVRACHSCACGASPGSACSRTRTHALQIAKDGRDKIFPEGLAGKFGKVLASTQGPAEYHRVPRSTVRYSLR
jgi:hypothetical protein